MDGYRLLAEIKRLMPTVVDPVIQVNPDGLTGYLLYGEPGKRASIFWTSYNMLAASMGLPSYPRSVAEVAQEIVGEIARNRS